MLVAPPPPPPSPQYVWIGGYWSWYGNWVWIQGRWAPPPQPNFRWFQPYYDHRGSNVVFVGGFWGAPGVSFVAPGLGISLSLALPGPGVIAGPPPMGPEGVFVPAPPGSVLGIIIPAPIGTAPAVVTGAPPVVNVGMRINSVVNNTTITNTNTTITNNVTNNTVINNVTIVAPASATATHEAVNVSVPAAAHLAAALPPVVRVIAPKPASAKPIAAYVPGRALSLPAPQTVRAVVPAALAHQVAGGERPAAEGSRAPPSGAVESHQAMRGSPTERSVPNQEQRAATQQRESASEAANKKTAAAEAEANRRAEANKQASEASEAKKQAAEKQAAAQKQAAEAAQARKQPPETAEAKKKAAEAAEAKKEAAEKAAAEKRKENPPPP